MGDTTVEQVSQRPHARLQPYVTEYVGYRMAGLTPGVHMGLPSRSLTFIVSFDDELDVSAADADRERYWAMVAGLHSRPATVHHGHALHGIQLSLTPLGSMALFGLPPAEMAAARVDLERVGPGFARELTDRLQTAATWVDRWAVLDDVFNRIADDCVGIPAPLDGAWALLTASDGTARIDDVADAVGWGRRRLSERFRALYGLSPKLAARVMRFERAQRLLRSTRRPAIADVAARCGYADQAHMTREWNEFAGSPPVQWLANEGIPILQDPDTPTESGSTP